MLSMYIEKYVPDTSDRLIDLVDSSLNVPGRRVIAHQPLRNS